MADDQRPRQPPTDRGPLPGELFRAIFDRAIDAMLVADDTARIVEANPAACLLVDRSREELLARRVHDLGRMSTDESVAAAWTAFLKSGSQSGEFCILRSTGEERLVEFAATANVLPGYHLSILRDISDRHRAADVRLRLATIVDSMADAVVSTTADLIIDSWNHAAERLYGYTADEAIGRPLTMLVPPGRASEVPQIVALFDGGETTRRFDTVRRRKDGRDVEVSITQSVSRDARGKATGLTAIVRDTTEDNKMRARLAISDRMASVGTLAAGVAHEINNPLAAVIANVDIVARALRSAGPDRRVGELAGLDAALSDAVEAAERVRHIVRDIKMLSRPDDERRGPVDVQRVLDSTIRIVWNEVRHRGRLVKDYAETPTVDASEGRLGQVFLNLLMNAAQSLPEGQADKNEIRVVTRADAQWVTVELSDTGCGIPEGALGKIFEPFFSTKARGIGTGLGLSICHGIVSSLGGQLTVRSSAGQGSVFAVRLPKGVLTKKASTASQTLLEAVGRSARILLVDDEAILIRSAVRLLTPPHEVVGTTDAQDALRRLRAGEPFDLILCDLMMPAMSGMDLYEEARKLDPKLADRFVFITGGAFTQRGRDFLEQMPNHRLEKPFDRSALLALVRDLVR